MVIGRIHSHLSLPSIRRGCSNLSINEMKLRIETKRRCECYQHSAGMNSFPTFTYKGNNIIFYPYSLLFASFGHYQV